MMKQSLSQESRPVIFLLSFLLLSSLLTPKNSARQITETAVEVEPHTSFAWVGETFNVNLTIINVQNLYGLEVTLSWNSSVLKLVHIDLRVGHLATKIRHDFSYCGFFLVARNQDGNPSCRPDDGAGFRH